MVQEVKAYRTTDGQVFDQRPAAVCHELICLIEEGLAARGYSENEKISGGAAAAIFFDILTENDSRVDGLLKAYRDCHPRVALNFVPGDADGGDICERGNKYERRVSPQPRRRADENAGISGGISDAISGALPRFPQARLARPPETA